MDDENSQRQPAGMDYAHLNFRDATMNLHNFIYTTDSISGIVKQLVVKEQGGLDIRELRTVFHYDDHGAVLDGLYLQTPTTILQDHVEVHYPSVARLKEHLQSLQLKLNVKNSAIGLHDVLVFVPELEKQDFFHKYKNRTFKVEAVITGTLDNLDIADLYAAGLENTEIVLNGRLSGLPEPKNMGYNLHISKFISSRKDISGLVPDSLLPSVRIPDKFGIMGQVAGTIQDYNADLYLASTSGAAYIKGSLATSPGKNRETYNLAVRTSQLNIGNILKQDSLLGEVTANFNVKGQSLDVKTMNTVVDGNIIAALVKGYRYHDITMSGKVNGKRGTLDMISADSNFRVQISGHADFSGKYAAAVADIRMDSIDFHALKLYSTELRVHGIIHADFPELDPDYPRGRLVWWQPVVNADGKRYYPDSIYIVSYPGTDAGQNIFADLDVAQVRITGKTPLTKIVPIIQEHINRHYKFPVTDSTRKSLATLKVNTTKETVVINRKDTVQLPSDYGLKITANVIDKPMLHSLLPGLTSFDSIHIDGVLSPKYLSLKVFVPGIIYGSTSIENGLVVANGTDSAFTYKITADKINYNKFALWFADIHGNFDKDYITTNISISDQDKKERFAIIANMQNIGDSQIVQLQPGLKLNYKVWEVAQPNRIVLANGGFYVHNFEISNSGQYIKANSGQSAVNTPLKIDITNFQLSNITEIASAHDTLLAGGILGGTVTIDRMTPSPQVTADMQVLGLSILGDTLGDLQLQVNNKAENALDTKLKLTGQGNDISLTGAYYTQPSDGNDFKFNLDVTALALHSFETIAMKQVRNSSGYLRGKLQAQGTISAPRITGELHTDNLVTTVSQLNATFKMPSEKIGFTGDGISFNNFAIYDSAGNKAVFNGNINIADLSDIQLNLTLKAEKWRALHSTVKDNKVFYGDLLLTTNLGIKGTVSSPSIDGDLKILKGTNMTIVNPESTPEIESHEGVVLFVNMKDTARRYVLVPSEKTTVKHKMKAGSEFNVNITIDKDAQFSLIIDQASGDFLSVKGDATINASVTQGGDFSLSGTYALHSGSYQLNYNFIKRKFIIKEGSIITFAGDPVKGTNLDVTAAYEAQIAPYDLVQRQVTDPAQLNYYKQRLPFNVDLHLKGPVLTPRLTFDIVLPENKVYPLSTDQVELIQGKLSQVRTDTSELNKQVFAILILSRFVSDDPFSSGAANSVGFTALQSVSTFIGEQLNQVAGKFIKGVDISADLATTQDYTTGDMRQRTDLNLAASKRLLNDRLKLTIGNDFELQGPQTNNTQNSMVPTNLAADYLLTSDGKYTIRAYRRAYDEGVLQGYVTETGLNFIVSLDYDKFKDVFLSRKNKKENTTEIKK
ncbi:MAG: translocation/assembly module TamB domain-containing protein [Chitinophagales bacterium]